VAPRVAVFGPHPLLSITIEARADGDDIHLHAAGQGVWVARMAGEVGAEPVLCGFIGGETGAVLAPLLEAEPGTRRLVQTTARSGAYVADRRTGEREPVALAWSEPPSRHELDDLVSITLAAALDAGALVVCNPMPGEVLPLEVYAQLVADARANDTPVLVDLSSPRLDSALEGGPDLVKVNDYELAEYVRAPVDGEDRLREAAERLLEAGAGAVLVTCGGAPGLALRGDEALLVVPPSLEHGSREGCGDSMMGALAAGFATERPWEETLVLGAAAGAANFLRRGLGTGSRAVIDELAERVELRRV
jgi:1-phosphofructokinase